MSKTKTRSKVTQKSVTPKELDSVYFMKLALYLVLGAQWLHVGDAGVTWQLPLPVGLMVGLFFANKERFQIDRKIEYAVLLIAAFVGFWTQIGLHLYI